MCTCLKLIKIVSKNLLLQIADFLKAGCEVTILFADLHAYLGKHQQIK